MAVVREPLRAFSNCKRPTEDLNILLVSPCQQYLENLQEQVYITREVQRDRRNYNLSVHTCKNINDMMTLFTERDFLVDFIVMIVDVNHMFGLIQVQDNIKLLDSSFGRETICIVNPNACDRNAVIKPSDLWSFAVEHQFNIINGTLKDSESRFHLTEKILNLAELCCGIVNGVPLVGYV